jgi:hypothetical protein
MSAGISAPHDPHPPRPPLGIHEPHPGPRASLPASLCPPCPITRCVGILGAPAPSPAHHATSQDVSSHACRPRPTCGKSHPITSCETLPPRTPSSIHEPLPGSAGALAGPSRPITRRVTPILSIEADVREVSPDCILWNPAGEGAGAPRGSSSWSAGIPVDLGRRAGSPTR